MLNQKVTVPIPVEESEHVERLFFEHKAGQDNIAFLMKDKEIRYDILQEYIDVVETRYVELELTKQEIADKHKPLGIENYTFTFDFRNNSIVYEEQ